MFSVSRENGAVQRSNRERRRIFVWNEAKKWNEKEKIPKKNYRNLDFNLSASTIASFNIKWIIVFHSLWLLSSLWIWSGIWICLVASTYSLMWMRKRISSLRWKIIRPIESSNIGWLLRYLYSLVSFACCCSYTFRASININPLICVYHVRSTHIWFRWIFSVLNSAFLILHAERSRSRRRSIDEIQYPNEIIVQKLNRAYNKVCLMSRQVVRQSNKQQQ